MIDVNQSGTHLFAAVDNLEVLAEKPLELDFKFCNKIEDKFHRANDWVIQESTLS